MSNFSDNETFEEVIAARVSRRGFLGGGLAAAALTTLGGVGALTDAAHAAAQSAGGSLLGFQGVRASSEDTVVVPKGYTPKVLIAWGDPVSDGPAFKQDAGNSASEQARQWGMHNDGLVYFEIDGSTLGLLVQNNEYTDDVLLFPDGVANWSREKTDKSLNAHGVSVIEIARQGGGWRVVRPSRYARRITGMTPIAVGGPAAGDGRLKTTADPTGRNVLGTLQNCAMGFTPWKTYLTCEENFNFCFRKTGGPTRWERRYGIPAAESSYRWHETDKRFRADEEPNEPNRFGWVVEIDPFDASSKPVKRTALGRFKHEGARVQEARDGRVVVLMGDDEQFEYIYRYVSNRPWREALKAKVNPLDDGVLYVARFGADGSGEWLPLTPSNPKLRAAGWSLNDILINTRGAADLVGATKMDRPEWIDTFSASLTAVATLTNNSARRVEANPRADAANPRRRNVYGHILRWRHRRDWTEPDFEWDIFALAGDPANRAHESTVKGDKYGSPDGLYVAPSGRLWIQTDVSKAAINSGDYAGFGNNQMLCADPATRETRRFLVGPQGCEVTGVFVTPDERTMFVGIQHPGEAPSGANDPANPKRFSSWPDGPAGGRPRSACVVITKDDGGPIGS
ncbi:MAG TPA: PhoX family phosphatase [Pyrinomonadaceae bacterium]